MSVDEKVRAKPSDLFVCRFKDGHEENLSVARLRHVGAAFSFTRAGIAAAPVDAPDPADNSGGSRGPGGGRRFRGPSKPGAQRILDAMSMSTLLNHRKAETVITASIHDDAELLVHEALKLLKTMKQYGREIGVSFWESPERKCLNECTLPLPAEVETILAQQESNAAAAIAAAAGGRGSGSGGRGAGGAKGKAAGCAKAGGQPPNAGGAHGLRGAAWPRIPGGWPEPRHCHTGPLIIWAPGPSRARARSKGDFQDHCCAALLGSGHFPLGSELMLLDGFLHGTGVLEKHAVFQPYERRPWPELSPEEASSVLGPAKVPPGASTRLQWKKKFLQVGKVPRNRESIYVCSSRQALEAATPVAQVNADDGSFVVSKNFPPIGTSPWTAALDNGKKTPQPSPLPQTACTTLTPDESRASGPTLIPDDKPATGGQPGSGEPRPHFQACIVCQQPGSSAGDSGADNGSPRSPLPPTGGAVATAAGPLLLCSTCPAAFHLSCLRPRLRVMPGGGGGGGGGGRRGEAKWSCAYCHAMGRVVGGDSDGACGAVRLMESLRQGVHGAIRVNALRTLRYNALG